MVTVALMTVLSLMFYGALTRGHDRRQAEEQLCGDNLQKIFLAMQIYANDFGKFPQTTHAQTSEDVLNLLVPKYTADTAIFICPGGRDPQIPSEASLSRYKISYAYYMGRGTNSPQNFLMSDRQINPSPKNIGDPVFSTTGKPPGNNHQKDGGNFLFTDGSVQAIPPVAPFSLAFSGGVVLLNPKP
jgi:prepilin-type processing-associated H-X9-DG protein